MNLRISDGDLDLNTRLNGDGSDLLHNIRRAEEIDHTLVYTELKPVPRVGSYNPQNKQTNLDKQVGSSFYYLKFCISS